MSASATNERAPCPPAVLKLVERFHEHADAYKQQAYKETQVRREFIDPFFTALGWDVANRAGHAEAYKDVIHEDAIKVGGSTKAPDYCFRIGGVRKFFVEAKKPVVGVKDEPGPAYQLRRYAWSNKLPLSIVTDFEELAVYDCRIKPNPTDKPSTARVKYIVYEEYGERWDEIASIFAKESILKGSFDKYAESTKRKRGTAEVDAEFLKEIEEWRELLARNIALRNQDLSVRELNFAVTRTIDRIIFLRMCEDRGVETYEQLRVLPNGPNIYRRLVELFYRADERYNSGLFHFQLEKGRAEEPDELTPDLVIDDRVLKDIIKRLYYPECPYEFSVLPAEILGHVYEQFLGKVIRLTKGHRAVVEEKPEVKKAGGVYYTPSYIVDYIVKHTVGKLLERKTPADVGPMLEQRKGTGARHPTRAQDQKRDRKGADKTLRILDPACGSGSFLLGAYQYLLDWHLKWYTENDPEKWTRRKNPPIYQVGISSQYRDSHGAVPLSGDAIGKPLPHGRGSDQGAPYLRGATWRLTVAERKRILLNNIYGVDIDPQAVEVTKLSLLLKVLEGENQQTLENQLRLFHERALPDLGSNIKCGNSLIGPDFYDNQQLSLLDEEERYRINAFDWDAEFPDIFKPSRDREGADKTGGFDAVIGNPPYVLLQDEFRDERQLAYFRAHYSVASYKLDTYHLFMERAISLTATRGRCAMITPANFITNNYLLRLRRLMLEETTIDHLLIIDGGVFHGASVDNAIFVVVGRRRTHASFPVMNASAEGAGLRIQARRHVNPDIARDDEHVLFTGSGNRAIAALWERINRASVSLGEIASINFGKQLRDRKRYTEEVIEVANTGMLQEPYKRCYTGRDVERYRVTWSKLACLDDQVARRGGCWDASKQDAKDKLLTRQIGRYPAFAQDPLGYQCLNTMFMINVTEPGVHPRYVLGFLNSTLVRAIWLDRFYDQRRTFPKIKGTYLKQLPVHRIDFADPGARRGHDRMVELVERMLSLHKELDAARTPVDKTAIGRQIEATDRQIDQLVYDLYGLTDDEIRIVEEGASS